MSGAKKTAIPSSSRSRFWWVELLAGVIIPITVIGWPFAFIGVALLPGAMMSNIDAWRSSLKLFVLALAGISGLPALAALGTAIVQGPERVAQTRQLRRWVVGLLITGLVSACLGAIMLRAPIIWAMLAVPALLAARYLVLILTKPANQCGFRGAAQIVTTKQE